MGLFQSLSVAVVGLQTQASKLGVVSDNIANVNTVGYKAATPNFTWLVHGFDSGGFLATGAKAGSEQTNQKNGLIAATDSKTDLAISGRGFFPVSASTAAGVDIVYTRAGSFSTNLNGDYLNSNGYFLRGWRLDDNGEVPTALASANLTQTAAEAALETVNVANLSVDAIPTSTVLLQANLKASERSIPNNSITFNGTLVASQAALPTSRVGVISNLNANETLLSVRAGYIGYDPMDSHLNMAGGNVTADHRTSATIYDAAGNVRDVDISYVKTAANTWAVEIHAQRISDYTPAVGFPPGLIASGNITFNPNGTLASIDPALTAAIPTTWTNPSSTSTLTFNFGAVGTSAGLRQSTDAYLSRTNPQSTYDPTAAATSMSAGTIVPNYTTNLSLTDNLGTVHTVSVNFIKTAAHEWGVEITAFPTSDITPGAGGVPGQIAYGTVTFNNDGSLKDISPALTSPIAVNWAGATEQNTAQFGWAETLSAAGLRESSAVGAVYASTPAITQNYAPDDPLRNMSSGAVNAHFNRVVDVVDNGGVLRTLNFQFLNTGLNTWAVEVSAKNATDVSTPTPQIAHGVVTFNGDGTLATVTPSLSSALNIPWSVGGPSSITLNLGTAGPIAGTPGATVVGLNDGLTQLSGPYHVTRVLQNGILAGENATVTVDADGIVTGTYTNGSVRKLYKIPLAQFISPDRLQSITGNIFAQTTHSGNAVYGQSAAPTTTDPVTGQVIDNGQSHIRSSALEQANVDLASEMSNMLIAQRAYQSNSKLISTTDQMLEIMAQVAS